MNDQLPLKIKHYISNKQYGRLVNSVSMTCQLKKIKLLIAGRVYKYP